MTYLLRFLLVAVAILICLPCPPAFADDDTIPQVHLAVSRVDLMSYQVEGVYEFTQPDPFWLARW